MLKRDEGGVVGDDVLRLLETEVFRVDRASHFFVHRHDLVDGGPPDIAGLAAYLARLDDPASLMVSAFAGRFYETYVINEIRKSFLNNGDTNPGLFYYRDSNKNEVDLVLIHQGKMHLGEIKIGMKNTSKDIRSFACLASSHYEAGLGGILCNTDTLYPLGEGHYVYPISSI